MSTPFTHYRVEVYNRLFRRWLPWTIEPFDDKAEAESHRLQILQGGDFDEVHGLHPAFLRVAEYETEDDRRDRLIAAWREVFPRPDDWLERKRESVLLSLVTSEALEEAVGLASGAVEPEYAACRGVA
jgi:hypothetical protein